LQETHAPPQATLQHTPSAQKPEAQSPALAHTAPFGLGPQLPATHFVPLAQSASDVHIAKQAFLEVSQLKGAHSVSGPVLQRPLPSQTLPPPTEAPLHAPGWQTFPATCLRQAPAPSHVPSRPQVLTSAAGHSLAARGVAPAAMNEHVPFALGALQVRHVSPQRVLQQTPSVQKPLVHSPSHVQGWPFGCAGAPPEHELSAGASGPASWLGCAGGLEPPHAAASAT
jgi:hypothetical protein